MIALSEKSFRFSPQPLRWLILLLVGWGLPRPAVAACAGAIKVLMYYSVNDAWNGAWGNDLKAILLSKPGYCVDVVDVGSSPYNPTENWSAYDQVWDFRFKNANGQACGNTDWDTFDANWRAKGKTYLQNCGNLFIQGENGGFSSRNVGDAAFLQSIGAISGGFDGCAAANDNSSFSSPTYTLPSALPGAPNLSGYDPGGIPTSEVAGTSWVTANSGWNHSANLQRSIAIGWSGAAQMPSLGGSPASSGRLAMVWDQSMFEWTYYQGNATMKANTDTFYSHLADWMGIASCGTPTFTQTSTATRTRTPTRTATRTFSPTPTRTATRTVTLTATPTDSPTRTLTATPTFSPSDTPTRTPTRTATPTFTPSVTLTATRTATPTFTVTATRTVTPTATPTRTATPTWTITTLDTATDTPTPTPTWTPTRTRTASPTVTLSSTLTATPTQTPTRTATPSDSPTQSPGPSPTDTFTVTATPTWTPTATQTRTSTATPTWTLTRTPTPTFTDTPASTATWTPTVTLTATPTGTPSDSPTATPSFSSTPTRTASPTRTPSLTYTETPVPMPVAMQVNIYNAAGERVRALFDGSIEYAVADLGLNADALVVGQGSIGLDLKGARSQGHGSLAWDGTNDGGQPVSGGVYTYKVEFRLPDGRVTAVVLPIQALAAPAQQKVEIFNSAGERVYQAQLNMAASGGFRLGEASMVTGADRNGSALGKLDLLIDTAQGPQTWSWNGQNDQGQWVSSGTYTVQLSQSWPDGRSQTLLKSFTVLRAPDQDRPGGDLSLGPSPLRPGQALTLAFSPIPGAEVELKLYDLAGEAVIVARAATDQGRLSLNADRLASGIYLGQIRFLQGAQLLRQERMKVCLLH